MTKLPADRGTGAKPPFGGLCNGCGVCCMAERCQPGEWAGATWTLEAGCSFQVKEGEKTTCGLAGKEVELGMPEILPSALGWGDGCSCYIAGYSLDDNTPKSAIKSFLSYQAFTLARTLIKAQSLGIAPKGATRAATADGIEAHFRELGRRINALPTKPD